MLGLKKNSHKIVMLANILAPFVCLGMYFLVESRIFPDLENENILSGGEIIPTEKFVEFVAPYFIYMIPVFIAVAIFNYFYLKNKEDRLS